MVSVFCIDPRKDLVINDAAGVTFWFAFVGLLTVSLMLRRAARRVAVFGYFSLFGAFWALALFAPVT